MFHNVLLHLDGILRKINFYISNVFLSQIFVQSRGKVCFAHFFLKSLEIETLKIHIIDIYGLITKDDNIHEIKALKSVEKTNINTCRVSKYQFISLNKIVYKFVKQLHKYFLRPTYILEHDYKNASLTILFF